MAVKSFCFLSSRSAKTIKSRNETTNSCEGHNRCCLISEELFDIDDYGLAHALNEAEVPKALEEKARLAVDNCPEFAISIED